MSSPIDRLIDQADLRCTLCGAGRGQCACWVQCSCGWSYPRGKRCNNPDTSRCTGKLRPQGRSGA